MSFIKSKKGFTLIELVMVIVILGILAAVAVPKFSDLSSRAHEATIDGTIGGVRAGITIFRTAYLAGSTTVNTYSLTIPTSGYPPQLSASAGDDTAFNVILEPSIIETAGTVAGWRHATIGAYTYYIASDSTVAVTYTPANGRFTR